ncbi:hypothetical protein GYMLUDRAFT_47653 [Collybiopsis luxurians FD-317 M1]|uniref:Protein kinase domain-containing protein n=1 Tax=Collybiopsis luxurians FD-317 M1 TaxID=944289 RepID=A0A0D0CC88_9AGAR|nr:hypothetical protein GYMLUDRAFT_47653 [Collybiopsis luxurians FD-317 M1]
MFSVPQQINVESDSINERLGEDEEFWRDHYDWLKEKGYQLRPRYQPGWSPSWKGTTKISILQEDYQFSNHPFLLDAVRIRDGKLVMLRRSDPESLSDELKISRIFSSEPVSSDPRNHCVPIYETLQLGHDTPDAPGRNKIVVMPYLVRWNVNFQSVGEVVDFCSQIFEGMQLMHSLHIAHNDVKALNIMMDWFPLYASPPHPSDGSMNRDWSGRARPRSRTRHPIKYYFIDYNLCKQFEPHSNLLQLPGYGGDQRVPEFRRKEMCDPFAVDVYCLGNVIRNKFLVGDEWDAPKYNLRFLNTLVSEMTHDNPKKRPNMDQVVSRFAELRKSLSWWKLRLRVSDRNEHLFFRILFTPTHYIRQTSYIIRRIPAIPDYRIY